MLVVLFRKLLIREWQTGALTLAQTYAGTATVFIENLAPASSKS
jgi:hypothetical protein